MGNLFVVATPLGNIEDLSSRAIKVLGEADFILSEDTRVGAKLLALVGVKVPLISYHQHSSNETTLKILDMLKQGKNLALITDAGTPGISDPGNELIRDLTLYDPNVNIIPIPGPSAVTAALSVSGFYCSEFTFVGFFPRKKQSKLLAEIKEGKRVFVFFESPHRILKTTQRITEEMQPERKIVVGRELTKVFETFYRGTAAEVLVKLREEKNLKGEFVVVIDRLH